MALVRVQSSIDVVEAARRRVINTFNNGTKVYMSFSGGKDSLAMGDVVFQLIQEGKINPAQLTVQFIDEEAIFDCIEQVVKDWRKKFMLVGAQFEWYCLEVRHFNCFNELTNDESFFCWDRTKKDVWIRQPPAFAITYSPYLKARRDTYQDFLQRRCKDGIQMVGVRTAESLQRLQYVATVNSKTNGATKAHKIFPIYDWKDTDVWKYLLDHHIDIPQIYLYLWQSGSDRKHMRVSQFFSVDTAGSLVKMNEYYPDLMDRIIRREPNAYLASLYWDSEMFGRRTRTRKELEGRTEDTRDYRAAMVDLFKHKDLYFKTTHQKKICHAYYHLFLKVADIADNDDFKAMYEGLTAGDPKLRTQRSLYMKIYSKYNGAANREVYGKKGKQ